jgi:catechol 2,3-dioxygenase-like lactoylglutathione lyase family enzyme
MPYLDITPVMPALDLDATLRFWTDVLGFEVVFKDDEYAVATSGDTGVHFWKTDDRTIPENSSCRIKVDDLDAVHETISGREKPYAPLTEKPWGREFAMIDPAGCLVWFAA